MDINGVTSAYERAIGGFETATLQRLSGVAPGQTVVATVVVRCRVLPITDSELMGGVRQTSQNLILLAADIAAAAYPTPIRVGDQLVINGAVRTIEFVDPSSKRFAGVIVAYKVRVKGTT